MKIVVVDDDVAIHRALKHTLKGHDVRTATSAHQAIDHMRGGADLLITDIRLPGASGGDLLAAKLCYHNGTMRRIPTIVLSGYVDSSDSVEDAGPIVVLPKPVDAARILRTLHRLCSTS